MPGPFWEAIILLAIAGRLLVGGMLRHRTSHLWLERFCSVVFEFSMHAFDKILRPSRRRNDSVSNRLAQFIFGGPGILRDREVFGESVRAVDGYGAGHPDQLAGFDIENFGELII